MELVIGLVKANMVQLDLQGVVAIHDFQHLLDVHRRLFHGRQGYIRIIFLPRRDDDIGILATICTQVARTANVDPSSGTGGIDELAIVDDDSIEAGIAANSI